MKFKSLIAIAATAAALSPAFAGQFGFDTSTIRSVKSRAEVIADTQIYQASGLAAIEWRSFVDYNGEPYRQARARYEALRSSPDFQQLVQAIALERGESVATATAQDGSKRVQ